MTTPGWSRPCSAPPLLLFARGSVSLVIGTEIKKKTKQANKRHTFLICCGFLLRICAHLVLPNLSKGMVSAIKIPPETFLILHPQQVSAASSFSRPTLCNFPRFPPSEILYLFGGQISQCPMSQNLVFSTFSAIEFRASILCGTKIYFRFSCVRDERCEKCGALPRT